MTPWHGSRGIIGFDVARRPGLVPAAQSSHHKEMSGDFGFLAVMGVFFVFFVFVLAVFLIVMLVLVLIIGQVEEVKHGQGQRFAEQVAFLADLDA